MSKVVEKFIEYVQIDTEPVPGALQRLNATLKIILIAYLASIAGSKANELFLEL